MLRVLIVVLGVLLWAAAGATAGDAVAEPGKSVVGRPIAGFSGRDALGRMRALVDYDQRCIVVAFLGTECPLAKLYGSRLAELSAEFGEQDVAFVGVASNVQDSLTEVAAYARRYGIEFPILLDADQQIADLLGAERTPEVFVLDADRVVRYRGRIDDQYGIGGDGVNFQRAEPQRRDLAEALRQLLEGKPVEVAATEPVGCLIGRRRRVEPRGEVTWSREIAPIFYRRCVECHRDGEIAPFPLVRYEDTVGWEAMIAEVIDQGRMPPWNANPKHGAFRNDARLTADEKELIATWIGNGCPEGDPKHLPPEPQFTKGWRIEQPDVVYSMRDKSFTVPAQGVVSYQHFEVDPGFEEDKYVVAAEARPGNRSVVHHIIVYLRPPGLRDRSAPGRMLTGYAPGATPARLPEGWAVRIPAGWTLLFELHYTPNGSVQEDISEVGLRFVDAGQVKHEVWTSQAMNPKFEIPPGVADHEVTARRTLKEETLLLSLTPHMHLRGSSFRYEAIFPGGEREILLDVPRYDFNWQLTYELAEPRTLPAGTTIVCTARYDNSADNLNNPDPTRAVRWGEQSWDEMMIGFFALARTAEEGE